MSKRLALMAVVALGVTACGGGSDADPAGTPSSPDSPSSSTTVAPARTSVPSTSSPTGDPRVAKPRVCYVPGEWTQYACSDKEFARNKVAVKKRLPKDQRPCVNAQAPRFYCQEASGRGTPSGG